MKKAPSYTAIAKAIAKAKTIKQLEKVSKSAINYAGGPHKVTDLYSKYSKKRQKLYSKTK